MFYFCSSLKNARDASLWSASRETQCFPGSTLWMQFSIRCELHCLKIWRLVLYLCSEQFSISGMHALSWCSWNKPHLGITEQKPVSLYANCSFAPRNNYWWAIQHFVSVHLFWIFHSCLSVSFGQFIIFAWMVYRYSFCLSFLVLAD